jgi:hypothetical protein
MLTECQIVASGVLAVGSNKRLGADTGSVLDERRGVGDQIGEATSFIEGVADGLGEV